mmetsp:Transcript_8716/g.14479  ORF Transcript_8716/g.14479 Transcript_8716/m.14479 type:complete len:126 (-) Transcript_8716:78-455(-)
MEDFREESHLLQQELVDHNDFFDMLVIEETRDGAGFIVVPPPVADIPAASAEAHLSSAHQHTELLRAKLHAKIASKQGNRPADGTISKRAARRAEKNKRREEAISRIQKASTGTATTTAAAAGKQ